MLYSNSIINIKRKSGLIDEIYDLEENNGVKESVIYVIIKGISDSFVNTLKESLRKTLKAVNCVVKDWLLMLQKIDEVKNELCSVVQATGYQERIADKDGKLVSSDEKNLGLMRNITEKWEDRFIDNLYSTFNTVEDIFIRYCKAFPISYQESFEPHSAYYDMKKLETVYTPSNGGLELSKILKITKNLGTKILSHNSYYVEIMMECGYTILCYQESMN
ncbi:unnamed protein product [Ceratitis capitata]|uniref:(Mediterranean fruit fly) hypothetical protein n=1 Tax=Ceratitis capitata TaxID=7213 RepID=A0A811UU76_CERCA|nr:unnamed protein product [Ceratitis capitata]